MALSHERIFEVEWPCLAKKVELVLIDRGVPRADREDIMQETGLRLLRMWSRVEATGARALATTIALNLWRDQTRRPRREVLGVVPDSPSFENVERSAIARADLKEVVRTLGAIPSRYRSALLAEVGCESAQAHKMVRLRARRALHKLTGDRLSWGTLVGRFARLRSPEVVEAVAGLRGSLGLGAASLAVAGLLLPGSALTDVGERTTSPSAPAPIVISDAAEILRTAPRSLQTRGNKSARPVARKIAKESALADGNSGGGYTPALPLPDDPAEGFSPGAGLLNGVSAMVHEPAIEVPARLPQAMHRISARSFT